MKLGISSHAYAWACGVAGYPQLTEPMTAMGLLHRAVKLQVRVVQIADNLPLDILSDAELQAITAFAERHGPELEIGTRGIEPHQLRTYLAIAQRLRSPLVRTLLDSSTQPLGFLPITHRLDVHRELHVFVRLVFRGGGVPNGSHRGELA
jgi:3-oxoisoapionate decarboxylase